MSFGAGAATFGAGLLEAALLAQLEAARARKQAQTDKAYDIQANIQQQRVVAEQVNIELVRKQREAEVQTAEIKRREAELIATVLRGAEIEKQKIETLAASEQSRLRLEAEGRAAARRVEGEANAAVTRLNGQAEADIIRQKGEAEADAMRKRADAFALYSQAAVLDKLLSSLPQIAASMSESVKGIDSLTVVSTGGDDTGGASRITQDVAKMVAQVPALVESLTGISINDLIKNLPALQGANDKTSTIVLNGKATNEPVPATPIATIER